MKSNRKSMRLVALMLSMAVLFGLAAPAMAASIFATVTTDKTPVYSSNTKTTVLGVFNKDDVVAIKAQDNAKKLYLVYLSADETSTGYIDQAAVGTLRSALKKGTSVATLKAAEGVTAPGTTAGTPGVIANVSSFANFRATASNSGKLLGTLKKGAAVTVLGTEGDFYKLTANGKTGYVAKKYVSLTSGGTTTPGTTDTVKTGTITGSGSSVAMRSKASSSASTVLKLSIGAAVTIEGESGSYYKVTASGKTGYVLKTNVKVGGSTGGSTSTGTDAGAISVGNGSIKVEPYQSTASSTVQSKLNAAKKINSKVIGYLSINGTNIQQPILFSGTKDVHYYASRDINNKSSKAGAIYAFYGQMVRNNTITGHNMRGSNAMFHQLHHIHAKTKGYTTCQTTDYKCSASSLASTPSMTSSANRTWDVSLFGYNKWEVFAMYETPANEPTSTLKYNIDPLSKSTPAQIKNWIAYQKSRSDYKFNTPVSTDDIFLTVYTCGTNHDSASAQSRIYYFLKAVK